VDGCDIGDDSVLADAAVGMDRASTCACVVGDADRAEVEQEDAAVRHAGLQGVPALVICNRVLFAGGRSGRYLCRWAGPRLCSPAAGIAPPGEM